MIECIFTIDYEIFGDGRGGLAELVLEPAAKLKDIFAKHGAKFVIFVETAELERIEAERADPAIGGVRQQLRECHIQGYELGLHVHPQWCCGRRTADGWELDGGEYNLCRLPPVRIREIIQRSLDYLGAVSGEPGFVPIAFRAGNWLLQPSCDVSRVLTESGIKIDSSVYKGGFQRQHGLDYRRSLNNGYFWRFREDVNVPDPAGSLIELPTYTHMAPFWELLSPKRLRLQRRPAATGPARPGRPRHFRDFLRLRQPLKLDFCRLTARQMARMLDREIRKDRRAPAIYRPIVAIGHTKDLVDFLSIDDFLTYLRKKGIRVTDFRGAYEKCQGPS
jgi:peptidoglycan/xylan/chitin deacetylase (PgdA/CDA1 family)